MTRIITALLALLALCLTAGTALATPGTPHKASICHRTASDTNPYVFITVDVASLDAHFNNLPGHPAKKWKSDGVWRGVAHSKGDLKNDYYATEENQCEDSQSESEEPSASPTPTPTSTSSATPTQTPTPTPTTTSTPQPTPTPVATTTATPKATSTPSESIGTPAVATPTPSIPNTALTPEGITSALFFTFIGAVLMTLSLAYIGFRRKD